VMANPELLATMLQVCVSVCACLGACACCCVCVQWPARGARQGQPCPACYDAFLCTPSCCVTAGAAAPRPSTVPADPGQPGACVCEREVASSVVVWSVALRRACLVRLHRLARQRAAQHSTVLGPAWCARTARAHRRARRTQHTPRLAVRGHAQADFMRMVMDGGDGGGGGEEEGGDDDMAQMLAALGGGAGGAGGGLPPGMVQVRAACVFVCVCVCVSVSVCEFCRARTPAALCQQSGGDTLAATSPGTPCTPRSTRAHARARTHACARTCATDRAVGG
jgi:hypothetical protein